MFQRNKFNYKIVATCTNGDKKGTYTFIENYDENWDEIAASMFKDEFGIEPTCMEINSREKV